MLRGQLRLDGAIVGRHKDLLGTHIRRCLTQSTLALPAALKQLNEHAWWPSWVQCGLGIEPWPEVHEKAGTRCQGHAARSRTA